MVLARGGAADDSGRNRPYREYGLAMSIIYGPVPSRRLGRSLGINNIPPKICSYSCVYCQLGNTTNMQAQRKPFYKPEEIARAVRKKLSQAREKREAVDFITFVPDGEPTLDVNLAREIELLKTLSIKIAVITNGSLIWRDDIRQALQQANYVSLKVDAVRKKIWHRIDRPHKILKLDDILAGMLDFASKFKGELTTETMLIEGINDDKEEISGIAEFLEKLGPSLSYLAIPTRPPAKSTIKAASEKNINMAYQLFKERLVNVEYLIGYEGNAFAFTDDVKDDLLSITSVHPMREDAVREFLEKAKTDWRSVEELISEGKLIKTEYGESKFYMRILPQRRVSGIKY
jgi:wyosine [tRNA(Phe)-imidazoG37] synthetase (radical SAM superfamily)